MLVELECRRSNTLWNEFLEWFYMRLCIKKNIPPRLVVF